MRLFFYEKLFKLFYWTELVWSSGRIFITKTQTLIFIKHKNMGILCDFLKLKTFSLM
jgi:hypothetical protein